MLIYVRIRVYCFVLTETQMISTSGSSCGRMCRNTAFRRFELNYLNPGTDYPILIYRG